jgi:hypothetical protein
MEIPFTATKMRDVMQQAKQPHCEYFDFYAIVHGILDRAMCGYHFLEISTEHQNISPDHSKLLDKLGFTVERHSREEVVIFWHER